MRVFAAWELPEESLQALERWRQPLTDEYPRLRWVRTSSMHLTIRFFGDINEEAVSGISTLLGSLEPGEGRFVLDRSGTFPGRHVDPGVYWLGGTFPESVFETARLLGRVPDDRGRNARGPWIPHVTVARSRGGKDGPSRLPDPPAIEGRLKGPVLFDSRLTRSGAEYSVLGRFDAGQTCRVTGRHGR